MGYRRGEEIFTDRGGLGQKAEVYDAELVGIAQAAKNAIRYADRHRQVKHIHIFADNTSAVTSAYEPKPKPGQKQMCQITHLVDGFLGRRRWWGSDWGEDMDSWILDPCNV